MYNVSVKESRLKRCTELKQRQDKILKRRNTAKKNIKKRWNEVEAKQKWMWKKCDDNKHEWVSLRKKNWKEISSNFPGPCMCSVIVVIEFLFWAFNISIEIVTRIMKKFVQFKRFMWHVIGCSFVKINNICFHCSQKFHCLASVGWSE